MGHLGSIAIDGGVLDLLHEGGTEEFRYFFVGVKRDEGGPNRCEDLILVVPLSEVIEDALFAEAAHETHIIVCRVFFFHRFLYFQ